VLYSNCPRCKLSVPVRASMIAPRHCPRCIGRAGVVSPMFESPLPFRLLTAEQQTATTPAARG
jgi:hypothetical protein